MAKIFDPLGVIWPVTFQMKVLFQELCKQKINWDDLLPTRIKEDWASWCNELARIEHVYLRATSGASIQTAGFSVVFWSDGQEVITGS